MKRLLPFALLLFLSVPVYAIDAQWSFDGPVADTPTLHWSTSGALLYVTVPLYDTGTGLIWTATCRAQAMDCSGLTAMQWVSMSGVLTRQCPGPSTTQVCVELSVRGLSQ